MTLVSWVKGLVLAICMTTICTAAVFQVNPDSDTDCSDMNCDLPNALQVAGSNEQDDLITIAAGHYQYDQPIAYRAVDENYSLSISGYEPDSVFINGGENPWTFEIDALDISCDRNIIFELKNIMIEDPGDIEVNTGCAELHVDTIGAAVMQLSSESIFADGPLISSGTLELSSPHCGFPDFQESSGVTISALDPNFLPADLVINSGPVEINSTVDSPIMNDIGVYPITLISAVEGTTIALPFSDKWIPEESQHSGWIQLEGKPVTLSDSSLDSPTIVAPEVSGNYETLRFSLLSPENGSQATIYNVTVTVADNEIEGFPEGVITFQSATERDLGIQCNDGSSLVRLESIDPAEIFTSDGRPENLLFGLINFELKVAQPGDTARVTFFLPEPAPEGYAWYKFSETNGWKDCTEFASFNRTRDQITLTLVDGGTGDDDAQMNGVIVDPSGLGYVTPSDSQTITDDAASNTAIPGDGNGTSDDGGKGGGCFIDTIGHYPDNLR